MIPVRRDGAANRGVEKAKFNHGWARMNTDGKDRSARGFPDLKPAPLTLALSPRTAKGGGEKICGVMLDSLSLHRMRGEGAHGAGEGWLNGAYVPHLLLSTL
jgi:hypothetical protein